MNGKQNGECGAGWGILRPQRVSNIYLFSCTVLLLCSNAWGLTSGNRKVRSWPFYDCYSIHLPRAPLSTLQDEAASGGSLGSDSSLMAALPDRRWEKRQDPSAIPHGKDRQCFLPCDQWPKTQVSSFSPWRPFLLIAFRLGRACSNLTHQPFLGPGHRESDSLWCLIRAHGHPSLASPYH